MGKWGGMCKEKGGEGKKSKESSFPNLQPWASLFLSFLDKRQH